MGDLEEARRNMFTSRSMYGVGPPAPAQKSIISKGAGVAGCCGAEVRGRIGIIGGGMDSAAEDMSGVEGAEAKTSGLATERLLFW